MVSLDAEKIRDNIIINWIGNEFLIEVEILITRFQARGRMATKMETIYQGHSISLEDFSYGGSATRRSGEKIMAFSSDGKVFREFEEPYQSYEDRAPIELVSFLLELGVPAETIINSFPYPGGFNLKEPQVHKGKNLFSFDNKEPILISWRDIKNPFDKTKSYGWFLGDAGEYELKMAFYSSGVSFSSEDERGSRTEGSGWYPSPEPLSLSVNQVEEAERVLQSFLEKVDQEKKIYQESLRKAQDEYNQKLHTHPVIKWFRDMSDIGQKELETFLGQYTHIVGRLEEKWLCDYLIAAAEKKGGRFILRSL